MCYNYNCKYENKISGSCSFNDKFPYDAECTKEKNRDSYEETKEDDNI